MVGQTGPVRIEEPIFRAVDILVDSLGTRSTLPDDVFPPVGGKTALYSGGEFYFLLSLLREDSRDVRGGSLVGPELDQWWERAEAQILVSLCRYMLRLRATGQLSDRRWWEVEDHTVAPRPAKLTNLNPN